MAKLDKAPVYETGDYWFESSQVRHLSIQASKHAHEQMDESDDTPQGNPREQLQSFNDESVKFHGWRLLGVIFIVCVILAGISALIDWLVIGPLEGRVL